MPFAALSIVATFGLSLILKEGVHITFGPTPRRILPPIQGAVALCIPDAQSISRKLKRSRKRIRFVWFRPRITTRSAPTQGRLQSGASCLFLVCAQRHMSAGLAPAPAHPRKPELITG